MGMALVDMYSRSNPSLVSKYSEASMECVLPAHTPRDVMSPLSIHIHLFV